MTNGNDLTNPTISTVLDSSTDRLVPDVRSWGGLTKREYFAAMAMQGIITADDAATVCRLADRHGVTPPELVGIVAVQHADALIEALNNESGQSPDPAIAETGPNELPTASNLE